VSKGCFVDKAHQPTSDEMRRGISGALLLADPSIEQAHPLTQTVSYKVSFDLHWLSLDTKNHR